MKRIKINKFYDSNNYYFMTLELTRALGDEFLVAKRSGWLRSYTLSVEVLTITVTVLNIIFLSEIIV